MDSKIRPGNLKTYRGNRSHDGRNRTLSPTRPSLARCDLVFPRAEEATLPAHDCRSIPRRKAGEVPRTLRWRSQAAWATQSPSALQEDWQAL